MSMNDITNVAAWWGAIIASLVLAWDIFKWYRSNARLSVSFTPNMKLLDNALPDSSNNIFLAIEVMNIGNKRTTITNIAGLIYKSRFQKWFKRKPEKAFILANFFLDTPLPFELEPGSRWIAGFNQNQLMSDLSNDAILYCAIYHSMRKKPLLKIIDIKKIRKVR